MALVLKIKITSNNGSKEQSFIVWWQWISSMNGRGTKWNQRVSYLKQIKKKESISTRHEYL